MCYNISWSRTNTNTKEEFPMLISIQQFEEIGIKKIEKVIEEFTKNPTDIASLVYGIRDGVISLGLNIIEETLEDCDHMLRESGKRKLDWQIVKQDKKVLTTSLGDITFKKTLFKNKKDGERCYLLDQIVGLEPHEQMTEDAEAKMLEEAVQTSYRKAGEETSLSESNVSKETVMNKLHALKFPEAPKPAEKKVVDYLYIDADEDHVALQFKEKKGDLEQGEDGRKNNCVLVKLVYVYEGVEPEAPKSKRNRLINPHYFSGVYEGEDNQKLWDEVYEYLDNNYDLSKVKKIYLNADGGGWIQAGKNRIAGVTSVLDEFHLSKYLLKMTGHMLESAGEARKELYAVIRNGTKEKFREVVEKIEGCAETEAAKKRVAEGANYILSNWTAAKIRVEKRDAIAGCSAEGHVSHVLSSRMSSRPMGWSRTGADRMGHLRAYYWNGGDMLELVRYQSEELPVAVGAENDVISSAEMLAWERQHHNELGKYVESITHSVSIQTKMKVAFNKSIYGL
ncbi:MAG: ISLre2 family transposase [Clostridiales bacterium]|nr:ISLre2 family transposase [Clostridiales bacterium]